ncbi:MAG: cytochrome c biogenesis protein ResB [Neisseriaceae bacterium]|nr:cytochrome c biogenesis protein ResB [Neisseriaceae bacterium]
MNDSKRKNNFLRNPLLELLSSMRFAVALLTVLAVASIIGTVIPQNRPIQDYVVSFGTFWSQVFDFLGLYDVYSSPWFIVILIFLVLSTALCLWRNVPPFIAEMRSFRVHAKLDGLSKSQTLSGSLKPEIAEQYLTAQGFQTQKVEREDGILIAAKKGSFAKFGYIFAHIALIVICLGGLLDSHLLLKMAVWSGRLVPDKEHAYASDFAANSRLSANSLSFRGDINLPENQTTDAVFLNVNNNGFVVQELPFTLKLNKFTLQHYSNGMPKDYASEITITDKKTGETKNAVVRVNHPVSTHGVTIYQAGFGDGGSPLEFDMWALPDPNPKPVSLKVRSHGEAEIPLGDTTYRLVFNEFKSTNVQADEENPNLPAKNVGATVTYTIADNAGQNWVFTNYMLPQMREGYAYYFYGVRQPLDPAFRWVALPADNSGSLNTFMLLRQALRDETMLNQLAEHIASSAPQEQREKTLKFTQGILHLFAAGGYATIDDFVRQQIAQEEQEVMARTMYQTAAYATNQLLDRVLQQSGQPEWTDQTTRQRFVMDSMQAYTGLTKYPNPLLLQLKSYEEINASGLQMTRSPGKKWVYLGSLLLTLGSILMFYVKQRRAWILLNNNNLRFAMSASRHKKDLDSEFPQHLENIQQLIKDFSNEKQ